MYLEENKTQISLSCIANMVKNKNYEILKYFVDSNHQYMRLNLFFIAKELDSDLADKIIEEKWAVAVN
jgi:TRAP-type C4-dicarboxylate transport system substrate-binding protein